MIKIVILDIDGVMTDGKVSVDQDGNERKQIDFKDIDAVFEMKRQGYKVGFITGENTGMTKFFERRFAPDFFYNGCKNKLKAINEIAEKESISLEAICYMGDGRYDVEPVQAAGVGVCPKNAIPEVKQVADICLETNGGDGCVWELLEYLMKLAKCESIELDGAAN